MDGNDVFLEMTEEVNLKVSPMQSRDGKKPSFEDYINEIIDDGSITLDNFEQHIRAHALAWNGAKLGKTNFKNIVVQIKSTGDLQYKEEEFIRDSIKNAEGAKKKFLEFTKFILFVFKNIDNEIIRLVRKLGVLSMLIFFLAACTTYPLLIELAGMISSRSVDAEMNGLRNVIGIFFIVYIFALDAEKKNEYLYYFRTYFTPRALLYLVFIGLVYLVIWFYDKF